MRDWVTMTVDGQALIDRLRDDEMRSIRSHVQTDLRDQILRYFYSLEDFISLNHLDVMGKILLATSLLTSYGYLSEQFMAWYGGDEAEAYVYHNRFTGFGQYATIAWLMLLCNVVVPQVLWSRSMRRNQLVLFIVSLLVLVGMWFERFIIVVQSLHRDYLPSSWGLYSGTAWDWAALFGSVGLFLSLLFLFLRFLPMISIFEMRTLLPGAHAREEGR